jgi:hypothetical protein
MLAADTAAVLMQELSLADPGFGANAGDDTADETLLTRGRGLVAGDRQRRQEKGRPTGRHRSFAQLPGVNWAQRHANPLTKLGQRPACGGAQLPDVFRVRRAQCLPNRDNRTARNSSSFPAPPRRRRNANFT